MEKSLGIIVGSIDYSESSKIVYLYTEAGKKSVMVLGAKKYKNNLLAFTTTLNLVRFEATDKKLPKLISYDLIDSYSKIKEDLNKVFSCELMMEILFYSEDDTYAKNIFALSSNMLDLIAKNDFNFIFIDIFLIKMLKVFGVNPIFKNCSICGRDYELESFSIKEGGILCKNCLNKSDIDSNLSSAFYKLYYLDMKDFDLSIMIGLYDYKKLYFSIKKYYEYHVNRHFRSFDLIEKITK